MQLIVTDGPDGQQITVDEARLDAAIATAFKDEMRLRLRRGEGAVTLELSQVGFMDSSGLGALIAVLKSMPAGRALRLRGLTPNVARVMRLTRMDTVFTILDADFQTGAGARVVGSA